MASIRKRGRRWQVQLRRRGWAPLSRTFSSRREAEVWARRVEERLGRDPSHFHPSSVGTITLGDLLKRYRDAVTPQKKSHRVEDARIHRLLCHPISQTKLVNLTSGTLAAFRDERLLGAGNQAVRHDMNLIGHALKTARLEWDIPLARNPMDDVRKPKPSRRRERRPKQEELNQIEQHARVSSSHRWLGPLVRFAVETAMRRAEILSLTWANTDLDAGLALLPDTKNGLPREVPLTEQAVRILRGLRKNKKSDRVFDITDPMLRRAWDGVLRQSKILDLHFHDLRHEGISRLVERGLSIPEVALISGHRDYRMLARYTHLSASSVRKKLAARRGIDIARPSF